MDRIDVLEGVPLVEARSWVVKLRLHVLLVRGCTIPHQRQSDHDGLYTQYTMLEREFLAMRRPDSDGGSEKYFGSVMMNFAKIKPRSSAHFGPLDFLDPRSTKVT